MGNIDVIGASSGAFVRTPGDAFVEGFDTR